MENLQERLLANAAGKKEKVAIKAGASWDTISLTWEKKVSSARIHEEGTAEGRASMLTCSEGAVIKFGAAKISTQLANESERINLERETIEESRMENASASKTSFQEATFTSRINRAMERPLCI
ncbi:hypothetical protein DI09_9p150 [Mitosporidium daphniae]|uniref:Uncharacterized protein n=1 Tax=Mitosporidium daphniae TaxID=1485682 RepID=A0A098VLG5_9MICR|nr:uncharacterized protein DI09_9p150 [Mitosporidium daphniae]KGG49932.1 hypothetical protein DI09_9p150 [Mitosporidium daphniae]|eukprot:XP_013236359.1 uncharacterized protein DI09_9p150 [Mitosporidium daphniae]